jgi:polysaccharide export outer membrane protein
MKKFLYISLILLVITSCTTKKDILYFQDHKSNPNTNILYSPPKIQVNDILNINISALNLESVIPFNNQNDIKNDGVVKQGYLVDFEGNITFPIIGKVKVIDLTTKEVEDNLKTLLESKDLLINPTINVRVTNSKITILGSINGPGTFTYPEANITLLQAIGYAGDLNLKGKRQDILIIREEGGKRTYGHVDLRKTDWFDGPYYYVKPNDVIYINPNGPLVKSAGYITSWTGVLSIFTASLTLYLILTR